MGAIETSGEIDHLRRRFLSCTALGIAAAACAFNPLPEHLARSANRGRQLDSGLLVMTPALNPGGTV